MATLPFDVNVVDPCRSNSCEYGNCVALHSGERYRCDCDVGYTGSSCETSDHTVYFQNDINNYLNRLYSQLRYILCARFAVAKTSFISINM